MDAEDIIGKEQDRDGWLGLGGQIKVEAMGVMDCRGHRAVLCSIAVTPGKIGKEKSGERH
jgi:hypothetical protein